MAKPVLPTNSSRGDLLGDNTNQYRVSVRFEDPDRLPIHFETQQFLAGSIINTVPGPGETNWVLRLDEPLACRDVKNNHHVATTFLLKPNGLDATLAMAHAPWEKVTKREIITMALIIDDHDFPKKISKTEDYRKYPLVSDARVSLGSDD